MSTPLSRREFLELSAGASAMIGVASPGAVRTAGAGAGSGQPRRISGSPTVPAGRSVVRASHGDGGDEPAAGVADRPRRPEARRQRRGRRHRHGRRAQRHRAEHDRHRRRRLRDGLLGEDEEARGAQRERPRAARAEPRATSPSRKITQMPTTGMETDHRAGRVRRLGHAAREARHDEARGSAGAGDRLRRERLPGHGEDRRPTGNPRSRSSSRPRRPRPPISSTARAPQPGAIFVQKNLARTFRTLARGGRDAFYRGEIARAIVDYCQKNGGFLSMEDFAAQKSDWVEPISTTYRGHTLYELPPNNQGLTALLLLNILEGIDLKSMRTDPVRYYHTLIEATKIAFADRNRYIADPAFAKVPVQELLSKDYAAKRRALIDPQQGDRPAGLRRHPHGQRHDLLHGRRQGPQRRVVHQQHLQLVRLRDRRRRHRHHAAQSRHRVLARAGSSQPLRARQAAVPHADSRRWSSRTASC